MGYVVGCAGEYNLASHISGFLIFLDPLVSTQIWAPNFP